MRKDLVLRVLAPFVVVATISGPAGCQAVSVWVEPRVGWLAPTGDLGRTDVIGNAGFGTFERADQVASLGLAGGVELSPRWGLRLSFDRVFDATVQGEWRCAPFVVCPSVLLPLEGQLSRWSATVDARHRLIVGSPIEPVLVAGIGVRRSVLHWKQLVTNFSLPASSFEDVSLFYEFGTALEHVFGRVTVLGEFTVKTSRFGGGRYESIEGSVEADRPFRFDLGLIGGVRLRIG